MNGGDSGSHTGASIGRTLETARNQRGLSLEQVEEATKIRTGYLRDLERENFDVLPAVYVQGSLRTYANFLHLDAEALVQEFKRRQAPEEKPPYPLYVGPPLEEDSLDDILRAAGGNTSKSRTATEEDGAKDAAPSLLPAGVSGYLYLGSMVFVILIVAAVAFALNAAGDRQPAVSQVREPMISRAPETSPPDAAEEAQKPQQKAEKSAGDEKKAQPERSAGSAAKDEGPKQSEPATAKSSASATATASAAPQNDQKATARPEKSTPEPSQRSPSSTQASAPARQTAPPSSPQPTQRPKDSGGGGGPVRVKVFVGGKDPVKLSGGPFDD